MIAWTSTIVLIAGCLAAPLARAVEIDMSEVRRIAQEPVHQILHGTPFIDIEITRLSYVSNSEHALCWANLTGRRLADRAWCSRWSYHERYKRK
jgi:hypothetical protein